MIKFLDEKDIFKGFETERLILREWSRNDNDDIIEGANNYNIGKWTSVPYPYTQEEADKFFAKLPKKNSKEKFYFAVECKENKKVIGGASMATDERNIASGGLWVNEKFHGKGYGTELWRGVMEFCFNWVDTIESGFLEGNEASWNMHKKIGFKLTGETREWNKCVARGVPVTEIRCVLHKKEYLN